MKSVYFFFLLATWTVVGPVECAPGRAPAEYSFFTASEFAVFSKEIEAFARLRGAEVNWAQGRITAGADTLSLTDLAENCYYASSEDYGRTIVSAFDKARDIGARMRKDGSFQNVSPFLSMRVLPPGDGSAEGIWKETLPELKVSLVYDLGDVTRAVKPAEARSWGKTDGELWARAEDNLRQKLGRRLKIRNECAIEGFDAGRFYSIYAESGLTHALVLSWSKLGILNAPNGVLLCPANSRTILALPVTAPTFSVAGSGMLAASETLRDRHPGPISSNLYWFNGETFHLLKSEKLNDGNYRIAVPDELKRVSDQWIREGKFL